MQRRTVTLLIFFLFLSLVSSGFAQNFFYSPEGKTFLEVSQEQILLRFNDGVRDDEKAALFSQFPALQPFQKDIELPSPDFAIASLQGVVSEAAVYELVNALEATEEVDFANHFLMHKDGTAHGISDRVLVGLRSPYDLDVLRQSAQALGAEVEKQDAFEPLLYHLRVPAGGAYNALEVANRLHEMNLFAYAEPDFLRLMKRMNTNDPYVGQQWSLNNDGNNTASYGGIAGADMKVFSAWGITTGSASIRVAIVDEGVDLTHADLTGNLESGYDATGQGSGGGPSGDDAHGTACAGIVAGIGNNGTGVAGVAYGARIVPVRIAYSSGTSWVTTNSWIGNALNWAWNNGQADVLSNSWGGGSSSSTINNAIDNAINNGRGGLGSPVLFAAGNDNGANSYPATYSPTISVIAMSMCNERKSPSSCDGETWWGSNYGTGADIAAPGVKIYATDISGSAGYSSGDYISNFNGTSSATPNAAGVMALILSANPALTAAQARYAIESTCDKVGGYSYSTSGSQPNGTWSTQLGYGRVNAYLAVQSVAPSSPDDAGISSVIAPAGTICGTTATPQVVLNNYGSNTLTSATIHYQVDGGAVNTQPWTGSLASLAATTISLPGISFTDGSHTFTAYTSTPNGTTDSNPNNDDASSSFNSGSNGVTLTILLDNYPEETSWEILSGGTSIASGGTYGSQPDGSTVVENICLPNGCFDFVIYDAYGDGICCGYGNGSYSLTEDASGSVLASGGSFGSSETTNFCVNNTPDPLVASISGSSDVSCAGAGDGSATASATGGTPPYSYAWSNGGNGATISGLAGGTYTVTVTDGNSDTDQASVVINEPSALSVNASGSDVSCGGTDNGSASASASGGTGSISYSWSGPGGFSSSSANISGLAPGTYSVMATDANGCTASDAVTISDPNSTFYADNDNDGFGDAANTTRACSAPAGYVSNDTDCDDGNNAVNPNAAEICDGIDNNCDGNTDEGFSQDTYYADNDSDGYGDAASSITACVQPAGYVSIAGDCDDNNNAINPAAPEICDGIDNNCDGNIDEGLSQNTYYADNDSDGYGDPGVTTTACTQPSGYVSIAGDCDDNNNAINPAAPEICDGIDNNCDGNIDEGLSQNTYYADNDGDGYGDPNDSITDCAQPSGYVSIAGDCDDNNNAINPGATEVCDGIDNNCNGQTDEIDCGGCTYSTIDFNDFEGGWGIWNDGGSDSRRSSQDAPYALDTYCIRLRDNTSSSTMTTDDLDLSGYSELTIDFSYYPRSMDNANEDFWLQISTNGGSSYTTVEEWNLGDEFVNDQRYYDQVVIMGSFTANTRLRFRCDASGNSDWVYIDEVHIQGCGNGPAGSMAPITGKPTEEDLTDSGFQTWTTTPVTSTELRVYPNPVRDQLQVRFTLEATQTARLLVSDLAGQVLQIVPLDGRPGEQTTSLPVDQLSPGIYFVHLITDTERLVQKVVVVR